MTDVSRVRVCARRGAADARERYSLCRPGELYMVQRREEALLALLRRNGRVPLTGLRVLEIGCGRGARLADFLRWDARPADLFGIDVVADFLVEARRDYPGFGLCLASGAALPFPAATFDVVMQSTVFTSILDPAARGRVAREMLRVARPGGVLIWYDFRYPSPRNRDVRAIGRAELQALFPGVVFQLRAVTLLPPLARAVARVSFAACRMLEAIPVLRSHYLALGRVPETRAS